MTFYRHDTWRDLLGAVVEARKDGAVIRKGLVEDIMPDSSALWIGRRWADRPGTHRSR
ncbi:MAG: hypothetical protein JWO49_2216 [Arthrobacter sp.]|nr:hypothetical protein [Arthrobacter sp.]